MSRAKNWKHSLMKNVLLFETTALAYPIVVFFFYNKLWKNPCQRFEIKWSFVATESHELKRYAYSSVSFGPPCNFKYLEVHRVIHFLNYHLFLYGLAYFSCSTSNANCHLTRLRGVSSFFFRGRWKYSPINTLLGRA